MIRMFALLAIVTCALASGAYAATYKWVDEQGVTHYGEKPPPGQKAQEVKIRATPPAAVPGAAPVSTEKDKPAMEKDKPGTRAQEQEREFQQRRIERLEKEREEEKQQARARAEAQRVKEQCIAARNNFEALNKDVPIYRLDEKGERKFIDDKTRVVEIAKAKKDIGTYCKS